MAVAEVDAISCLADTDPPQGIGDQTRNRLGLLGLTALEEDVYRLLVSEPGLSVEDLRTRLSSDRHHCSGEAEASVDALQRLGLLIPCSSAPRTYGAGVPSVALEGLRQRRILELEIAREEVDRLTKDYANARKVDDDDPLVEVVRGVDELTYWTEQFALNAREDSVILAPAPLVAPPAEVVTRLHRVRHEAVDRGVRRRVVVDSDYLSVEGCFEAAVAGVAFGEQFRAVRALPLKMEIMDAHIGLLYVTSKSPEIDHALLVRESTLLEAMKAFFEMIWDRAVPFIGGPTPASAPGGQTPLTLAERDVLRLIASGLKDEAAAYRLGVAPRTFARRVAEVMRKLGADTRFQAGYLAAKRGWL